jgi:ribonuclease BN (tRNA processing enzyme)
MKIQILGTRGEVEPTTPYHARHSGILIDDRLMFDLGEQEFLNYKPECVFITHLHPDHAFFVRDVQPGLDTRAIVYAPEDYSGLQLHVLKHPISCSTYKITPIPTEHSIKVKSQAYIIQKGVIKILYTGDLFWIDKKYHSYIKNLDLVITEASFIRKGGVVRRSKEHAGKPFGHTGIPDLMRIFSPYAKRMLFMHFGSWFYEMGARGARAKLKKLGLTYDLDIIVGYDGQIVYLSK